MTEPALETHHHRRGLRRLRAPSASIRSSRRGTASPSPGWLIDKQLKLGLDLKGGVHLVLRVQTDDALRLETEPEMERLREALHDAQHHRRPTSTSPDPTQFRVEGVPPDQDAAFRQAAAEVQTELRPQLRRQRHLHLHDEAERPGRRCAKRRSSRRARRSSGASTSSASPSRASRSRAADGDQILVQLPGVTDVNRAKEIIRSTGLLELKIVEQGPSATREALLVERPGAAGHGDRARRRAATPGEPASTVYYLVRKAAAVTGTRSAQRAAVARREQPAGGQLHAEHRRRRASSARSPARTSAASSRSSSTAACSRRRRIEGRITTDGRITGSFTQEEVQNLSLILRSGALPASLTYLEERTIGPTPRRRLDPLRRHRLARRPAARHRVHARLLQAVGRERRRRAACSTWSSCSA